MDRYSRWVAILKVLLPLVALGLLSTLFLLSQKVDPDATIPFADREIASRLRDQQITAPTYAGTSSSGEDVYLAAATVSPPVDGKPARAKEIEARLEGEDGQTIRLSALRGTLEEHIGKATLEDAVVIETSTGYVIETNLLNAQLDQSEVRSPGEIRGTGPLGDFTAGSMEIMPKKETDGLHILFTNGVRLIYEPKRRER